MLVHSVVRREIPASMVRGSRGWEEEDPVVPNESETTGAVFF